MFQTGHEKTVGASEAAPLQPARRRVFRRTATVVLNDQRLPVESRGEQRKIQVKRGPMKVNDVGFGAHNGVDCAKGGHVIARAAAKPLWNGARRAVTEPRFDESKSHAPILDDLVYRRMNDNVDLVTGTCECRRELAVKRDEFKK